MKIALLLFVLASATASPQAPPRGDRKEQGYLGFDRNEYPGDSNLMALRQTFSYTGYWLNIPPGARNNSWKGKRQTVEAAGFGFLVLFNGRTYAEIKSHRNAARLGASDAAEAIRSARGEAFPAHTVIFLDQEQGGRLLQEQREYLLAWVDAINAEGFEAGVYCSGIAAKEGSGESVITAEDIEQNAGPRKIKYWVVNDSCPPSPGCSVATRPYPEVSGIPFADVWQFAQSPKRRDFAESCQNTYDADDNCYGGLNSAVKSSSRLHLDLNVATSSDPSNARSQRN